jgi:hypothetical protein
MGAQIPCGVYPQRTVKSFVSASATVIGGDFPCLGPAEGVPDSGRPCDARSCAYVYCDSSKASGFLGDWLPEGERAIAIAREFCSRERNFTGEHLGDGDMRYPPSGLSWSRWANTFAPRRKRMDRGNHFKFGYEDAL